MIIIAINTSWHFNSLPTTSKPFQFKIKYPMIVPIIPYKQVDAPAFMIVSDGLVRQLKIFPPIPEIM